MECINCKATFSHPKPGQPGYYPNYDPRHMYPEDYMVFKAGVYLCPPCKRNKNIVVEEGGRRLSDWRDAKGAIEAAGGKILASRGDLRESRKYLVRYE